MRFSDTFTNAGTNLLETYNNWIRGTALSAVNVVDTALFNNYTLESLYHHNTLLLGKSFYCEADIIINTVDLGSIGLMSSQGPTADALNGYVTFYMSSTELVITRNSVIKATKAFVPIVGTYRMRAEILRKDGYSLLNLYIDGVLELSYTNLSYAYDQCGIFFSGAYYANSIDNFEIHELDVQHFCDDGSGL